jgi:hypothetical protein
MRKVKTKILIYTIYDTHAAHAKADALKKLNVKFTTKDVLNNFWGVQFDIEQPSSREEKLAVFNVFDRVANFKII